MKEDGIHENFYAVPEMPWKRKEREMDNEFKKLVLRFLALLVMLLMFGRDHVADVEVEYLVRDSNEYVRRLG